MYRSVVERCCEIIEVAKYYFMLEKDRETEKCKQMMYVRKDSVSSRKSSIGASQNGLLLYC